MTKCPGRLLIVLVATLVAGLFTARAKEGPYPVWWSPSLELESLDKIDARLVRKLWPDEDGIEVYEEGRRSGKKEIADTCVALIRLSEQGYRTKYDNDFEAQRFQLATCRAIKMLKKARPATTSHVREFDLNHDAVNQLPALARHTDSCDYLCRQVMANGRRIAWHRFEEIDRVDLSNEVKIEVVNAWSSTTVEILARADLNGDGLEDLLMRTVSGAIGGTWAGAEIYAVTRESPDGVMWVLGADRYLCPRYTCDSEYDYPAALAK